MPRKRYSRDYMLIAILEFLFYQTKPISKYAIMTKMGAGDTSPIRSQRQDRVNNFLNFLERRGWIKKIETEHYTYYEATIDGKKIYSDWGKKYLEFAKSI